MFTLPQAGVERVLAHDSDRRRLTGHGQRAVMAVGDQEIWPDFVGVMRPDGLAAQQEPHPPPATNRTCRFDFDLTPIFTLATELAGEVGELGILDWSIAVADNTEGLVGIAADIEDVGQDGDRAGVAGGIERPLLDGPIKLGQSECFGR